MYCILPVLYDQYNIEISCNADCILHITYFVLYVLCYIFHITYIVLYDSTNVAL